MKDLKERLINESSNTKCKYCDLNNKKLKALGVPFGNGDTATLYMVYDDCNTNDELEHFQIVSKGRHVDAWAEIQFCPFCGRKLE